MRADTRHTCRRPTLSNPCNRIVGNAKLAAQPPLPPTLSPPSQPLNSSLSPPFHDATLPSSVVVFEARCRSEATRYMIGYWLHTLLTIGYSSEPTRYIPYSFLRHVLHQRIPGHIYYYLRAHRCRYMKTHSSMRYWYVVHMWADIAESTCLSSLAPPYTPLLRLHTPLLRLLHPSIRTSLSSFVPPLTCYTCRLI
jgi:hypothetical protein